MLKLIIPIVASCEAERQAMLRTAGGGGWFRALEALACAHAEVASFFYFDDEELRAGVGNTAVAVITGPAALPVHDTLRIPGALPALRHLLRTGDVLENDRVVLVNWRFCRIRPESLIMAAEKAAARPGAIAISVQPARDNPVQYMLPRRIVALDHLVFPDPAAPLPAHLANRASTFSRPLFLDWKRLGCQNRTGDGLHAAIRDAHGPYTRVVSWSEASSTPGMKVQGVYRMEGAHSARKAIPAQDGAAAPAYSPDFLSPVRAVLEASGEVRVFVPAAADLPETTVLRLWATTGEGVGCAWEFVLRHGVAFETRLPSGAVTDGLLVALLDSSRQDTYDFFEPVHSTHGLWAVCPHTKHRLNPATQEPMHNRQQFPQLLEINGVLAAGAPRALLDHQTIADVTPVLLAEAEILRTWPEYEYDAEASPHVESAPRMPSPWVRLLQQAEALGQELRARQHGAGGGDATALAQTFETVLAALECETWPILQMSRFVNHVFQPPYDQLPLYAESAVGSAIARLDGVRKYLWSLCDIWRTLPLAADVGKAATLPRIGKTIPQPAGVQLPLIPWKLASDGVSRLFVSAYDLGTFQSGLFCVDVHSGQVEELPGHGRIYGGLWFDRAAGVLYATHLLRGETRASGMDVLDAKGALLERAEYVDDTTGGPFLAHSLTGNSNALYFADATSRDVIVMDKGSLRQTQRISKDFLFTPSAIVLHGDVLSIFSRTESTVTDVNIHTGESTVFANPGTRLLYKADTYLEYGLRYGFCYEYEPYSPDAQLHWLHVYDAAFRLRSRHPLGKQRTFDLHILQDAGVLVLADYWRHLQLFPLRHGGHGQ